MLAQGGEFNGRRRKGTRVRDQHMRLKVNSPENSPGRRCLCLEPEAEGVKLNDNPLSPLIAGKLQTRSPSQVRSVRAGACAFLFTFVFLVPSAIIKWMNE